MISIIQSGAPLQPLSVSLSGLQITLISGSTIRVVIDIEENNYIIIDRGKKENRKTYFYWRIICTRHQMIYLKNQKN